MDKLSQYIYNYSNKGYLPNEYFINFITEALVGKYSLNQYIKQVIISNFDNNSLAYYSLGDKTIYINFGKLIYSTGIDISSKMKTNSYEEKILAINLYVLKVLLHELEHANQEMKMNNQHEDLETTILKLSNEYEMHLKKLRLNYLDYRKLYFTNPLERQAELSALRKVSNLVKDYKCIHLSNLVNKEYLMTSIADYTINDMKCIYPIETYFNFWDKYYDILDSIKNIPLLGSNIDMRLDLGLRISSNEYDKLNEKVRKILNLSEQ